MRKLAILALCLIAGPALAEEPGQMPGWMSGCWQQPAGERWVEECWTIPRGGQMLGWTYERMGD